MWGCYRFGGREQGFLIVCTSLLAIMKEGRCQVCCGNKGSPKRGHSCDFGDWRNVCSSEVAVVSLGTGLAYLSSFSLRGLPSILLPSTSPHPILLPFDVYVLCENWPREMRVVGGEGLPIPSSGSPLVALGSCRGACSWICPGRPRAGWLILGGPLVPLFCRGWVVGVEP